jgi:hypothetical protein
MERVERETSSDYEIENERERERERVKASELRPEKNECFEVTKCEQLKVKEGQK